MALRDTVVDAFLVVSAVTDKRGHRPRDLVEQGTGLGAIVQVVVGQRRGEDPAGVGVHAEMERLWGGGEVTHHRRRTQPDGDAPCHGKTT